MQKGNWVGFSEMLMSLSEYLCFTSCMGPVDFMQNYSGRSKKGIFPAMCLVCFKLCQYYFMRNAVISFFRTY